MSLKLYMHPVSTFSRPVRLFIAEKKLPRTISAYAVNIAGEREA